MSDLWKFVCLVGLCVIVAAGLLGVRGERLKRAGMVALLDRAVGLLLGLPLGGVGVLYYTLSNNTAAQWPWPVVAAFVVLFGGLVITLWHDRRRREQETIDLKASIYAEIADFSARCLNDYFVPWSRLRVTDTNKLTAERVQNFRPTRAIVVAGVAGKLGALATDAPLLTAVTQFYYRYDALAQMVESVLAVCEKREAADNKPDLKNDQRRVGDMRIRLRSCFRPALAALKGLKVAGDLAIDAQVARVYPHLKLRLKRENLLSLRDALEAYQEEADDEGAAEQQTAAATAGAPPAGDAPA
jgi:hypothetical protein